MLENKKVLITGGAGLLATNLIKKLISDGNSTKVWATLHCTPAQYDHPDVNYIEDIDLVWDEGCEDAIDTSKPDIVIHCAANTSGAGVMASSPMNHVTPNVAMNNFMLDAAYQNGVKTFVFISSNTVYPNFIAPMHETEAIYGNVFDKYYYVANMKQWGERQCEMYRKIDDKMKTIIIRPGNMVGPYDDFKPATSHVVPALIRKVVERHSPIEVWGDGKDIKDFVYVDDVVDGILLAIEKDESNTYNIASGEDSTINQALHHALKADGYAGAEIVYNMDKPSMIPIRRIDISKAKKELGFEPKISLEEGIKRTVKWYREVLHNE